MTKTFKIGDIVCYAASFLKAISWHTDVPQNGKVIGIASEKPVIYKVKWSDGSEIPVNGSNLILDSERHIEPV